MKKVTVFSLSTCPACKKVKRYLEDNSISYNLIEVDTLGSGEQWLMTKELSRHNPERTYPTVVLEEVITGYDVEVLNRKLLEIK